MSEDVDREWHFYLDDMIAFAEKEVTYSEGFDQERFTVSGLNYDAVVRKLEMIGESATHIPADIRESQPQIPSVLTPDRSDCR